MSHCSPKAGHHAADWLDPPARPAGNDAAPTTSGSPQRVAITRPEIIDRLWAASEYASYGDFETALQVVRDLVNELQQDQDSAEEQREAAA